MVINHGQRQFKVMAYHDAVHDDMWAIELAELADDELGPDLITVFLPYKGSTLQPRVRTYDADIPLPILQAFLDQVTQEQQRLST